MDWSLGGREGLLAKGALLSHHRPGELPNPPNYSFFSHLPLSGVFQLCINASLTHFPFICILPVRGHVVGLAWAPTANKWNNESDCGGEIDFLDSGCWASWSHWKQTRFSFWFLESEKFLFLFFFLPKGRYVWLRLWQNTFCHPVVVTSGSKLIPSLPAAAPGEYACARCSQPIKTPLSYSHQQR